MTKRMFFRRMTAAALALALGLSVSACDLFKKYEASDFSKAVNEANRRIQSEKTEDGFVMTQNTVAHIEIPPLLVSLLALAGNQEIVDSLNNLVDMLNGAAEIKIAADKTGMLSVEYAGAVDYKLYLDKNTGRANDIATPSEGDRLYGGETMTLESAEQMYTDTLGAKLISFDIAPGTEPVIDKNKDREYFIEYTPGAGEKNSIVNLAALELAGLEADESVVNLISAKIIIHKDAFFSKEYTATVDVIALIASTYSGEYLSIIQSLGEWLYTINITETVEFTSAAVTVPEHEYGDGLVGPKL